jgi:hypothetical protein
MKFKTLITATLLGLSLSMAAQSQVVSRAYEVGLEDFREPATENGGASFKACEDCARQLVRVTAATQYIVNGKTVRFDDFRKLVTTARRRGGADLVVLHHLESDTIKSINVSF